MYNRMMWSRLALIITIAVSILSYLWIGFDSIGDPIFSHEQYALLLSSLLLPFCAGVWFKLEGNDVDSMLPCMLWGFGIGVLLMFVWLWMLLPSRDEWGAMVFLVFAFPMMITGVVYTIMLGLVLTFALGVAYLWERFGNTHRVTHR